MANIIKEKNIYTFELDPTKQSTNSRIYALDINTGEFINAKTGRTLTSNPQGIKPLIKKHIYMSCVMYYIYKRVAYWNDDTIASLNPEILMALDKLDAINCPPEEVNQIDISQIKILVKHLGELAKIIQEKDLDEYSLYDCVTDFSIQDFMKAYNLEYNNYFTREDCNILVQVQNDLIESRIEPTLYMPRLIYHYQRGVWALRSCNRDYLVVDMLVKMAKYAHALQTEIPKGDFMRAYVELYKNYIVNKTEIDNKALAEWNDLSSLAFETDELCVVIPKTVEEFKQEGDSQSNCVYTMYLQKVIENKTRVVFIRQKSNPTESYITCEVDNNGNIRQYLTKYNYQPQDESAIQFKALYQDYLNTVWAKG